VGRICFSADASGLRPGKILKNRSWKTFDFSPNKSTAPTCHLAKELADKLCSWIKNSALPNQLDPRTSDKAETQIKTKTLRGNTLLRMEVSKSQEHSQQNLQQSTNP